MQYLKKVHLCQIALALLMVQSGQCADPGTNQRVLYNGHKKVHPIKFQSVAVLNGLVANLYGPVEGKWHYSYVLNQSDLFTQLVQSGVDLTF